MNSESKFKVGDLVKFKSDRGILAIVLEVSFSKDSLWKYYIQYVDTGYRLSCAEWDERYMEHL